MIKAISMLPKAIYIIYKSWWHVILLWSQRNACTSINAGACVLTYCVSYWMFVFLLLCFCCCVTLCVCVYCPCLVNWFWEVIKLHLLKFVIFLNTASRASVAWTVLYTIWDWIVLQALQYFKGTLRVNQLANDLLFTLWNELWSLKNIDRCTYFF